MSKFLSTAIIAVLISTTIAFGDDRKNDSDALHGHFGAGISEFGSLSARLDRGGTTGIGLTGFASLRKPAGLFLAGSALGSGGGYNTAGKLELNGAFFGTLAGGYSTRFSWVCQLQASAHLTVGASQLTSTEGTANAYPNPSNGPISSPGSITIPALGGGLLCDLGNGAFITLSGLLARPERNGSQTVGLADTTSSISAGADILLVTKNLFASLTALTPVAAAGQTKAMDFSGVFATGHGPLGLEIGLNFIVSDRTTATPMESQTTGLVPVSVMAGIVAGVGIR